MAEKYLFFNSTAQDPRIYQAEDMAIYWESFLTNGVVGPDAINTLEVTANGSDMNVSISIGRAVIEGHLYINDEPLTKIVSQASGSNRIDRLVLRFDNTLANRSIKAFVKEGSSTPPPLTRNDSIWEISLARITARAGQSFLLQSDIVDERPDPSVCGFSTILASKADASQISLPDELEVLRSNNVNDAVYENNLLGSKLNVYRSQLDDKGIFRLVENRRANNAVALRTQLSNPDVNGNYQTQVITIYENDGTTVYSTETWTITYDASGNVLSEVRL